MRANLSARLARPEPSSAPAFMMFLAFIIGAGLSASIAMIIAGL